jgi:TPR repeat protein
VFQAKQQVNKTRFILLVNFTVLVAHSLGAAPRSQAPATAKAESVAQLCAHADSGDSSAIRSLNRYLVQYDSGADDYAIALDWLRARAARDNPDAEFLLGYLFEHGHGVPQDLARAAANYQAAANRGNSFAQNNLASLYQRGLGVPRDLDKAFHLYTAAALQRNPVAETNLASMYYVGAAARRDYSAAARWFLAAAEQGDSTAQHDLGVLYFQGLGVPKDLAAAAHWEGLAAINGNPRAQTDLAYFYETGSGVPRDNFAAYLWYSRAIAAGDTSGSFRSEAVARCLNPKQRDEGHALATTPSSSPRDPLSLVPSDVLSVLPNH